MMVELSDAELDRLADALASRLADMLDRSPESSPYRSIPEAAEYLRCDRQRIDDLLSARKLSRHKEGGRTLLLWAELEQRVKEERR